jgi:cytochrome c556
VDEIRGSQQWIKDHPDEARQVLAMLSLDMTGEDTAKTGGETRALPKIWETKADFDASFEKFGKDATAASTKIVDEASFKAAYGEVLKNCDSCHDTYRQKR